MVGEKLQGIKCRTSLRAVKLKIEVSFIGSPPLSQETMLKLLVETLVLSVEEILNIGGNTDKVYSS